MKEKSAQVIRNSRNVVKNLLTRILRITSTSPDSYHPIIGTFYNFLYFYFSTVPTDISHPLSNNTHTHTYIFASVLVNWKLIIYVAKETKQGKFALRHPYLTHCQHGEWRVSIVEGPGVDPQGTLPIFTCPTNIFHRHRATTAALFHSTDDDNNNSTILNWKVSISMKANKIFSVHTRRNAPSS